MYYLYYFKKIAVKTTLFSKQTLLYTTFVALLLFLSSIQDGYTQSNRPYLELPFPGEATYEVTCGYGCYQHQGTMSYAVDFAVPEGDPILAAAAGTVKDVTWERGLPIHLDLGDALILYLDHGNGWFTRYVHLDGITVEVGQQVEMGDIIGYGGKTGASGAHLHFELKYGDSLHSASVPINELFDGKEPQAGKRYMSNNWTLANKALAKQSVEEPQEIESVEDGADLKAVADATDAVEARAADEVEPTVEMEEQVPQEVAIEPTVEMEEQVAIEPTVETEKEPALGEGKDALPSQVDIILFQTTQATEEEARESQSAAIPVPIEEQVAQVPYIETGLSLSAPSVRALSPITATFTLRNGSSERLHLATLGVVARPKGETNPLDRTLFFERSIVLNPGRSYDFQQEHTFKRTGDFELLIFAFDANDQLIAIQGSEQITPLHVEGLPNTLYLPLVNRQ